MKSLTLPPNTASNGQNVIVESSSSIVIVGANGSGKSRMGAWIEISSPMKETVHRISAQKSLQMPESTRPDSMDRAESFFRYGYEVSSSIYKIGHRWQSKPTTALLNDYAHLMNMLFAEDFEVSTKFRQQSRDGQKTEVVPETRLDRICEIWNNALPHRKIEFGGGKIEVKAKVGDATPYNGAEMSDGERVIFYLIGECLCVPQDAIIVIDEPEIHIHKTVQVRLFNEIEKSRPDCLIVYITHDLEFASSRTNATKVCLNSFDGANWDWYVVPETDEIPEEIYLEVLGSRKSVLFLEGEKGSLDTEIYSRVYPEMSIRPLGSCTKVIEATKSFNSQKTLHHINAFGMIDRDYRAAGELSNLASHMVFQPSVSEVENIFLIEPILKAVARQLLLPNQDEVVNAVKEWVMQEFDKNIALHVTSVTFEIVDYTLKSLHKSGASKDDVSKEVDVLFKKINIDEIFGNVETTAKAFLANKDYAAILAVMNQKGIVKQVGRFFNVKPTYYIEIAKQLLDHDKEGLLSSVKEYLPDFEEMTIVKTN